MPARLNLQKGDAIGGRNKNLIYIKDAPNKDKGRYVLVYDKDYNEYFEDKLATLRFREICHSFQRSRQITNYKNTTWFPGEIKTIMGQPIMFIKENDKKLYPSGELFRTGTFKNLNTDVIFDSIVSAVISGNTLGVKRSKGEIKVEQILKELNISYETEYSFKDFLNNQRRKNFPFDFYLPDYNCCIEYDGEQHYKGWKRDKNSLSVIQERDKLKNEYCDSHGITLLRIPYFDFNKLNSEYLIQKLQDVGIKITADC